MAVLDPATDLFYLIQQKAATVTQFDSSMAISNTLTVANSYVAGLIVFSSNSNFWIYGGNDGGLYQSVLIALDSSFTVLFNKRGTMF